MDYIGTMALMRYLEVVRRNPLDPSFKKEIIKRSFDNTMLGPLFTMGDTMCGIQFWRDIRYFVPNPSEEQLQKLFKIHMREKNRRTRTK